MPPPSGVAMAFAAATLELRSSLRCGARSSALLWLLLALAGGGLDGGVLAGLLGRWEGLDVDGPGPGLDLAREERGVLAEREAPDIPGLGVLGGVGMVL